VQLNRCVIVVWDNRCWLVERDVVGAGCVWDWTAFVGCTHKAKGNMYEYPTDGVLYLLSAQRKNSGPVYL
jgi:hypothetical protein